VYFATEDAEVTQARCYSIDTIKTIKRDPATQQKIALKQLFTTRGPKCSTEYVTL